MECITGSLSITSDLLKRRNSVCILCSIFKAEKGDVKDFFFSGFCVLLNIKYLEYKNTLKTHHSSIHFSLGNRG